MKTDTAPGTTWASWMEDRTTTAYSPHTHPILSPSQPLTSARPDEAELMWLDDEDLLSVSEPSFAAASSGSLVAKCVLLGFGLFAAVLFGHLVLASGQADVDAVVAPKQ